MTIPLSDLREILLRVRYLYANMPEELKEYATPKIETLLGKVKGLIQAQSEQQAKPQIPEEPPSTPTSPVTPQLQVPDIARQLWALARGNPDIFSIYMRSYPNDQIQSIGNSQSQLDAIMHQINNTQSQPPLGQADGVQQAPLQSSNVYGYRFDPFRKRLTVRFQGGSVYRYEGVPKVLFDYFSTFPGVAKTTGQNKYGKWWRGKESSIGATFHQLIKLGGFPYIKIK